MYEKKKYYILLLTMALQFFMSQFCFVLFAIALASELRATKAHPDLLNSVFSLVVVAIQAYALATYNQEREFCPNCFWC